MTFLNPLLLLGLLAAAIPLIIHLFNFRKPKRVDFSSLAFLKELQKTTMQRVRIKQWLLLLLRTLAIACLVLAFARPTLTGGLAGTLGGRAASSLVVIIDNSLSMTLRDAQGAYLAQAKEIAAGIINQTEPGDEVFLLTTADVGLAEPTGYKNRGPALDAVTDVEVRNGAARSSRTVARAAGILAEAANLNKEIYLISDLQRSTLADSVQASVPEDVRLLLVPVGERTYANVAVTEVRVNSRIVEVGQPVQIEATLANYGTEAVEDYVASVYLEGERVAQAAADLAPGATATVAFAATPQQRGWLSGLVQIEDDAFEYDNLRYFTLNVPERRRVLIVRGEDARTDFLELALSSRLTQERIVFDLETIPENALAAAALGQYDAVVLVGPRTLSSGETAALVRYVDAGGGLLVFPGAGALAPDYNALFEGLGGGRFSGFSGELGPGPVIAGFDRVDLEHPLFDGVFEQSLRQRGQAVESPSLYFSLNYTPGTGTEQTLIHLSNGFPFMQELRHGRGAAFLVSVAPDPRWSDLPVRGLFIPLLYRAIYYLSASEQVAGEQLLVGTPGELRLGGVPDGARLRLVAPGGDTFTPEQRSLFGAVLMQTDASLHEAGVYDVMAGETRVRRVAFNLDGRESDLQTLDGGAAAARLADVTGRPVRVLDLAGDDREAVVRTLEAERTGVELWNVFMLLALVFLLAEMLVARQWQPEAVSA